MKKIRPGFYADDKGAMHIDIPELLREMGVEDCAEAREAATRMLNEIIAQHYPESDLTNVRNEKCCVCRGAGRVAGFLCARCSGKGYTTVFEDLKPKDGGN